MFGDYLSGAFKNIVRHKLRSLLTVLGVVIGIASVVTVLAIGSGGKGEIEREFERFGVNGLLIYSGSDQSLKISQQNIDAITQKVSAVKTVMPLDAYMSKLEYHGSQTDCAAWSIGKNYNDLVLVNMLHGRKLNSLDISTSKNVCLIDDTLANKLFNRTNAVGRELELTIEGQTAKLKIVGVAETAQTSFSGLIGNFVPGFAYVPYTTLSRIANTQNFTRIIISVRDGYDIDETGERVVSLLDRENNRPGSFVADNMLKQKAQIDNVVSIVTLIISSVAAVSLVVGGIGIMTIMLVAVNERKKEIGMKKAIGATKNNILFEFLTEAVIITLLGGVIGLLFGIGCSFLAQAVLGFKAVFNVSVIVFALLFCIAIGIIFSIYPARKAASLDPIEALKCE